MTCKYSPEEDSFMKEQKGDRKRRNEAMDRFITDSAIKILGTHSLEEL